MAKRLRTPHWGKTFQRSLAKMARSALRAGTLAMVEAVTRRKVVKPARAHAKVVRAKTVLLKLAAATRLRPAATRAGTAEPPEAEWTLGIALGGASTRRWRLYRPPGSERGEPLPLLVMLHGCNQDAVGLALSSRMNRLAASERFLVLYVEQDRMAHGHGCWNWYETRNGRGQAEAGVIVAAVDQVVATCRADPDRVAIAGLSAGAGMAALVASRYPQRFRAVAMHSGIAPGAAHSTATALSAMQGRRKPVLDIPVGGAAPLPPLLVIHGNADGIVRAVNGREAANVWATALSAREVAPRTVQRGSRHPMTVTEFRRQDRVLVSLCEVHGLGHAWSGGAASQAFSDAGGPDASRLIWAFALRQFKRGVAAATPT